MSDQTEKRLAKLEREVRTLRVGVVVLAAAAVAAVTLGLTQQAGSIWDRSEHVDTLTVDHLKVKQVFMVTNDSGSTIVTGSQVIASATTGGSNVIIEARPEFAQIQAFSRRDDHDGRVQMSATPNKSRVTTEQRSASTVERSLATGQFNSTTPDGASIGFVELSEGGAGGGQISIGGVDANGVFHNVLEHGDPGYPSALDAVLPNEWKNDE